MTIKKRLIILLSTLLGALVLVGGVGVMEMRILSGNFHLPPSPL